MTIPIPTSSQLRWQKAELGLFCHFGINTFYGREWSDGTLDPSGFNPQKFDPAQWVETAQQAGMNYLVLTAKHHDGFCLWPTRTTNYSVSSSPFKRDIVGEVAKACEAAKMPLGLYLSPWDRNAPCYSDKTAYDEFYLRQMTELCTLYGGLFEVWLDGAGSEGRTYDWDSIMNVVETRQPKAVVFNMGRPTIRWIGNEEGLAADPCFYAVDAVRKSAFTSENDALSEQKIYLPPECDVAIRQNWFWQDDDLHTLKSKEHLLGILYRSLGNGANLLLNVPPNRDGLLDEHDCARLLEVARERQQRFNSPLEARISPVEGGALLDFGREVQFDHLVMREDYHLGQRINGYRIVDAVTNEPVTAGTTVGHQKWEVFPSVGAKTLRIEWGRETTQGAALTSASAFLTGHEERPQLGRELDYEAWGAKTTGLSG